MAVEYDFQKVCAVSILVVQGPHRVAGGAASQKALIESIADRARSIGATVLSRTCSSIADIAECLGGSCPKDTEMVLLDSGDLDSVDLEINSDELRGAIDALRSPYIEVHDASTQSLEPRLQLHHSPMVTLIINNNLKESYVLAMEIAANRLRRKAADCPQLLQA